MALTRITKGVIKPNENYDTHNINSTGIVTAIGLDVNGNADISGNFSVGGVLTYEDVTSIDSVGIITAQKDIHVGAGVSVVGIVTAATGDFFDLDVDGHTNLDDVSIAGIITSSSDIDLISNDAQLLLEYPGRTRAHITANYYNRLTVATNSNSDDISFGYTQYPGNSATFSNPPRTIFFMDMGEESFKVSKYGVGYGVTLNGTGNATFTGIVTATGADINGDIDVDGHTNLDNVSIAGVVTATSYHGDGSNLTGVSGFATALSNDQSSSLNVFFKTPKQVNVSTGESIVVQSDATSGNIAFCRESIIHVSTGATMRVATGTQLRMNVLDLF